MPTANTPQKPTHIKFPIRRIYELLGNAVLLTLRNGEKAPTDDAWQRTTWEQTQKHGYQTRLRNSSNVGVLLGENSGGLVAVDVDQDDQVEPFLAANPWAQRTLRTRGAHGVQFWARIDGYYPKKKLTFRTQEQIEAMAHDKKPRHVAEFRTNGCQSVIRGTHPQTKKRYRRVVEAKPVKITYEQISYPSSWIEAGTQKQQRPGAPTEPVSTPLHEQIASLIRELCLHYYPNGTDEGNQYRLGSAKGEAGTSFCICLEGDRAGWCYEHNGAARMFFTDALAQRLEVSAAEAQTELRRFLDRGRVERWRAGLARAAVKGAEFRSLKVRRRKRVLDTWFKEGDAGFLYSARGVGKTMLAYGMAKAIAKGRRFGPWVGGDQAYNVVYLDGEMPLELMQERDKAYPEPSENLYLLNHEFLFDRTGLVFNIADPVQQRAITHFCLEKGAGVLFVDNLSSLASGVAESDADDWEKLQPWLLDLRRRHIAVVIVHHAGRSGLMRGTSRREDNVFWIIKLSAEDFEEAGCKFLQRFEKNRNAPRDPDSHIWTFKALPNGLVEINYEISTLAVQLVERLRNEPTSARVLMNEFKLSHSTIYRELNRLQEKGVLGKSGKIWTVL